MLSNILSASALIMAAIYIYIYIYSAAFHGTFQREEARAGLSDASSRRSPKGGLRRHSESYGLIGAGGDFRG